MSTQVAVKVEHISKNYGSFKAVDDLSFQVYRGEIFGMLGPNGAGKSTTIRMILDILRPDTGRIEVLGAPIDDRIKDRIGYLPEERGLYRNVKVVDVMTYLGELKGLASKESRRRALELLERLGLSESAFKKTSELSKGMQQKVQFAVTVMHEPDLMIVDEPFSGLDPVNTMIMQELVMDMRKRGTAVIMSTHQMSQVEEMCDRLLMINRGHAALYGDVAAVRKEYASHAVIIEGRGDFSKLPGVTQVTKDDERDIYTLYLDDHTDPRSLMASIASTPAYEVDRFELAVPSLNDIFIRVVEGATVS